jgi:hypothetical protein
MTRLPDWPERLAETLQRRAQRPFTWRRGGHCAALAAEAVHALTGRWPALPVVDTEHAAAMAVRALGGSLAAAVDRQLPRLATPWLAWRGDVLLLQAPEGVQTPAQGARWGGLALGVADGERAHVVAAKGLAAVPAAWAVAGWAVGHGAEH